MAEKEKIQEMPEGWKKASLKSISKITMGQSPSSDFVNENEIGMPFLQGNAEFTDKHPKEIFWVTKPKKIAQRMDILLSVRAPVGETNIADKTYCIGRGLSSIRFTECSDYYGWYLIQFFKNQLIKTSQGSTFTAVNKDDISAIHVIYPINYPEQHTIASILSTCDEAIEKTDVKIEKLKRIKQGLMQDLFRYGIDENGKMRSEATHHFKNSPLGRIPEEWEVKTINDIAEINPPKIKIVNKNIKVSFFPMESISEAGKIIRHDVKFYYEVNKGFTAFKENDVLFAKITPCMENGKGALAIRLENSIGFGSTEFHVIRAKDGNDPKYIYYLTMERRFRQIAKNNMTGTAGQQRVPASFILNYCNALPPKTEQSRIASVLSSADEAIEKEEAYKNKLLGLKRGLMDDLLSGKVRVNKLTKEAA